MVCKGPNVILGRSAIKYFWPSIYDNLLKAAANTKKAADALPAKPPEVLESLCEIASLSVDGSSVTSNEYLESLNMSSSSSESEITQEEGKIIVLRFVSNFPKFSTESKVFSGVF